MRRWMESPAVRRNSGVLHVASLLFEALLVGPWAECAATGAATGAAAAAETPPTADESIGGDGASGGLAGGMPEAHQHADVQAADAGPADGWGLHLLSSTERRALGQSLLRLYVTPFRRQRSYIYTCIHARVCTCMQVRDALAAGGPIRAMPPPQT